MAEKVLRTFVNIYYVLWHSFPSGKHSITLCKWQFINSRIEKAWVFDGVGLRVDMLIGIPHGFREQFIFTSSWRPPAATRKFKYALNQPKFTQENDSRSISRLVSHPGWTHTRNQTIKLHEMQMLSSTEQIRRFSFISCFLCKIRVR